MWPTFKYISAGSVKLGVELAEVIVDWCGTENAHSLSLTFLILKPLCLNYHAKTLNKEYATEYRQHKFLMNDNGTYCDDTSNSK